MPLAYHMFFAIFRIAVEIELDFEFPPPKLDDILSGKAEMIADDGYRSSIHEKGQGVQRSVIFSILRTYCELRDQLDDSEKRNSIFAIEEPEICLHPAVKRATYNLFRNLGTYDDQVICSTHDGYFVDVRHFDEIRLLRRIKVTEGNWITCIKFLPIENIVLDGKNRYGKDIPPESIRETFNRFYDPARNEGFFAKKVVLVEGQTEEYVLPVYFKALGFDVDHEQVAVISAGSVQHMDVLFIVFNELGIPCYPVFDGDKPLQPYDPKNLPKEQREDLNEKSKRNMHHLKIFGAPEIGKEGEDYFFPSTTVHERLTIFESKFEVAIHHPLANYTQWKSEARQLFNSDSKPLIGRYIANKVVQDPDGTTAVNRGNEKGP